ncbi:hypothetical protein K435DRAFT_878376 [Dendrothele bispora CBS 962.96]|uniref:Uncharacterized protein n=1 Tax=Dendrothele bispora (strain CBS 962.96) TaxID=1314807 RepID=A0A4S8KN54_DENBC|nr:hypothetical protein K435DRAFT_878376 [Dendrothele bispora CBS 962.96]
MSGLLTVLMDYRSISTVYSFAYNVLDGLSDNESKLLVCKIVSSDDHLDRVTGGGWSRLHVPIQWDPLAVRFVEILEACQVNLLWILHPGFVLISVVWRYRVLDALFCDINRYLDPPSHTTTSLIRSNHLRSQLDAAYSKFVRGKEPRTLKTLQIFRGVSVASVADISTTTLRVIDRASDAFPPLKSAVGGANASKARAQQLRQRISKILDRVPSDLTDVANDLEM